jgi:hypothetical protein
MRTKLTIIAGLFVLFLAVAVSASAEEPAKKETTHTFSVTGWTEYIGGNGALFHEYATMQSDWTVDFPGCGYGNVWVSFGLDDSNLSSNFGDELDLTVGCAGSFRGFNWDTGLLYIDVVPLMAVENDIVDPYISLSRSFGSWGLTLKVESYLPVGGEIEGGWLVHLRGSTSVSVAGRSFGLAPSLTRDDGAFGFDPAWMSQLIVSTDFAVGDSGVILTPKLKVVSPLTSVDDGRGTEVAYGLAIGF